MMDINLNSDSPVSIKISFNKLLERYEELAKSNNKYTAKKARRVLDTAAKHPALRAGFTDISLLETYKEDIGLILEDTFSPVLTTNEIKAASVPWHNIIFNSTKRFKNIL